MNHNNKAEVAFIEIKYAYVFEEMEKKDKRRVKVYTLGEDSNWVDKGTGHVDCTFIEVKRKYFNKTHFFH